MSEVIQDAVTAEAETPKDTIEVVSSTEESVPDSGTEPVEKQTQAQEAPELKESKGNLRNQQRKAEKERLIRENATKDAELKQAREELAKLKQPESKVETKREVDLSKEPDILNYTSEIDYLRDLAKYDAYQALAERDSKVSEERRVQQIETYQEQADIIRATMPDFDAKVDALYDAGLIQPDSVLENAILASPDNAKLAEHFVKYPGDLKSLNMYKPEEIPAALKQIRNWMKSQGNAQPAPLRTTQAAPPIKPPSNSAKTGRSINSYTQEEIENMPLSEYKQISKN